MRGTLRTITSSSVRRQAARAGRAAFLLPAGTMLPESGAPPSMTNFSMRAAILSGADDGAESVAKAISTRGFSTLFGGPLPGAARFRVHGSDARRSLAAVLRMDQVRVPAQARAGRRGRDGRLRARARRGRGALGGDGHPARPRLRALSRSGDRAPALCARGAALTRLSG